MHKTVKIFVFFLLISTLSSAQFWKKPQELIPYREGKFFGYVNSESKTILPCNFKSTSLFHNNYGIVRNKTDKYSFIDVNGKTICPFKYDKVDVFSEERAAVFYDKYWGYINT
jgi:hypothetical protein